MNKPLGLLILIFSIMYLSLILVNKSKRLKLDDKFSKIKCMLALIYAILGIFTGILALLGYINKSHYLLLMCFSLLPFFVDRLSHSIYIHHSK